MRKSLLLSVLVALLSSGLCIGQARADVAPPPWYVEQCTLEKQQVEGKSCVTCPSGRGDMTACENQYAGQGYTKACNSYGASVWTEIWCLGGSDAGAGDAGVAVPPNGLPEGCSCRSAAQTTGPWGTALMVIGAAILTWRLGRRRGERLAR